VDETIPGKSQFDIEEADTSDEYDSLIITAEILVPRPFFELSTIPEDQATLHLSNMTRLARRVISLLRRAYVRATRSKVT
jgi:hypothetical protein